MVLALEVRLGPRAREYLGASGTGRILNVFSSSFYCRIEGKGVILFHPDRYGIIPFGVGCGDMASFMARLRPVPDLEFAFRGLELDIPGLDVRLVLKPAQACRPSASALAALGPGPGMEGGEELLSTEAIRGNEALAEEILERRKSGLIGAVGRLLAAPPADGIGSGRAEGLWKAGRLAALLRGLEARDMGLMDRSLDRMIGLGTGLTPTMDDVLTGLAYTAGFLGRHGWACDPPAEALLEGLSERGYERTTEISGAYLRAAALGDEFSLLEGVEASILLDRDLSRLEWALDSLLDVGSDSGGNMLVGILLGISLWVSTKMI